MTATETKEYRYCRSAHEAGCPRDQVESFIRHRCVLQPKQLQASAIARLCDEPDGPVEIGYGGARGGGKSHWLLAQMGVDDCQRVPELKCLLLRKVGKAAKESLMDLRSHVLMSTPNTMTGNGGMITFPNRSRIVTGHFQNESDIDQYLGLEYDVIGIEEATTLTPQKYKDIQTVNRSSKPGFRPRIYSTTNPGGVGHTFYRKRFIDPYFTRKEIETRFVPATIDDNEFVNPDYRKVLDSLTGWKKAAWREGDWDITAGQFFTTFSRKHHLTDWEWKPEPHWDFWCGFDYGFTHYTAIPLFCKDGDGMVYVVDFHAGQKLLPEQHANGFRAMLARHGIEEYQIGTIAAGLDVFSKDHRGNTIARDYERLNIILTPANDDRINGAAEILTRLGDPTSDKKKIPPRLKIHPRNVKLIDQLIDLEHNPNRPEDVLKVDVDEEGNGGDDFYDGLRYGIMEDYTSVEASNVEFG